MGDPDFLAQLTLLTSKNGGRASPLGDGYRSLIRFNRSHHVFGMQLNLPGTLGPGQTGEVEVRVLAPDELPLLKPGDGFDILEGLRVVGHGVVVSAPAHDIDRR